MTDLQNTLMKELDKRYSDIITTNPGRLKSITTSIESNYKLKFLFSTLS